MKTKDYLELVRERTGFNDYNIAKHYDINQSNLSKYSRGNASLSESHAFLFANILNISPAQVVADTKLELAIRKNDEEKIAFWQTCVDKYSRPTQAELNIAIAQINPVVGELDGNASKMIDYAFRAKEMGVSVLVFPELVLVGYPPEDLLLRNSFIDEVIDMTSFIVKNMPDDIYIIFGSIEKINHKLHNSAFVVFNQNIVTTYQKQKLPNYGVFDEKRYFCSGVDSLVIDILGKKVGIVICEDIWYESIIKTNKDLGAQVLINLNASPFTQTKLFERKQYLTQIAKQYQLEVVYVNCVGGQDELVFDGGSLIINNKGDILCEMPLFSEEIGVKNYDIDDNYDIKQSKNKELQEKAIYDCLVLATKDYIYKNGFSSAVLGLSGGIDSALTLAIVVDAIGAENVQSILMPSPYTATISLLDAQTQANIMGVVYENIAISPIMNSFNEALSSIFSGLDDDVTEENIQARIRGVLLMAFSNKKGAILLTTGNKSEYAVGYSTLYGDMNGGFAPLKDVYKLMVYRLAKYRNTLNNVIPERVLTRAPSAELSLNQTDQDTLPSYEVLDDILYKFIEQRQSVESIISAGHSTEIVKKIVNLVLKNEHKRRQSAPGVKISDNAFGKERRYPITSKFTG